MPKVIHQETMCCGNKRCPTLKVFEDGSAEISDDDVDLGSVGTVKLRPEVVSRLVEVLSESKR